MATATAKRPKPVKGEVVDAAPEDVKNVSPDAPQETAVAVIEPEVVKATVVYDGRLGEIATDIMSSWKTGIEESFSIGRLLVEAATILNPKARSRNAKGQQDGAPFTDWFNAQGFPFSMKTAQRLRFAAENEAEVRALIEAKTGRDMGVNTAAARLIADKQPSARVKAVQALVGEEPETSTFVKFKAASEAIDLTQLPDEELAELAGIVKALANAYNAEAKARKERSA